ncbi:MAG TPA: alpha-E domain-containing protein [Verrucomicrobiae bacterium]|nr:alpha-E domain-containing protein [Verrucomicrobiae bacterium]
MLSRVADSIYWMSRYIERAENVARFIDVNLHLMLDLPTGSNQQWRPLVDTTGDHEEFERRLGEATQANVIQFLTLDPDNPNSILSCLRAARENARSVREIISSEMWEQINKFYLMVTSAVTNPDVLADPHEFFSNVRMSSHLFVGVTEGTMTHGEGWHFARLGRMLERADKTSRILDVKYYILLPTVAHVGTTFDDLQWAAVLRSASAFEMYRKTHGRIDPRRIVEFLLLNPEFPRAIHYCLIASRESVHAITGTPTGLFQNPAEQLLAQLCADLAYAQVDEIVNAGLHEYLDGLQTNMNLVGARVAETFFAAKMSPPSAKKRKAVRV